MGKLKVIVADAHPVVRKGVFTWLRSLFEEIEIMED